MTTATTELYRAIITEIERRRLELGIPMWQVDDAAGTPSRYFAKILYADTPSGRQAGWGILQEVMNALFPTGFSVTIKEKPGACMLAGTQRVAIRFAGARYDLEKRADWMRELSKRGASKGGHARAAKLSKRKASAIGKKAARKRWSKPQLTEIPPPESVSAAISPRPNGRHRVS